MRVEGARWEEGNLTASGGGTGGRGGSQSKFLWPRGGISRRQSGQGAAVRGVVPTMTPVPALISG